MTIQTNRLYDYRLNKDGVEALNEAKKLFSDFQETILGFVPPGRNAAIVKTKLEEASFFLTRAVAEQEAHHTEIITH